MAQQDTLKRFRGPGKTAFWNARPQHWMDRVGMVFQPRQNTPELQARTLEDFATNYLNIRSPLLTHLFPNESSLYAVISENAYSPLRIQSTSARAALKVCKTATVDPKKRYDMQWLERNPTKRSLPDFNRALLCSTQHMHNLYLYRAADTTVLYVGQSSKHPGKRPLEHLKCDEPFGALLMANFDLASSWTGEVLTLNECEQLVMEALTLPDDDEYTKAARREYFHTNHLWAINTAEQVLIWMLRPCCNIAWNPFPTPIPTDLYRLVKENGQTKLLAPAAK